MQESTALYLKNSRNEYRKKLTECVDPAIRHRFLSELLVYRYLSRAGRTLGAINVKKVVLWESILKTMEIGIR
jgi:hypothetical protein